MNPLRPLGSLLPFALFLALCLLGTTPASAAYKCDTFLSIGGNLSPSAVTTADGSVWYIGGDRLIRVRDRKASGVVAVDAMSNVEASGLAGLLQALPGHTVVQFSSYDQKCGPCVISNPVFDAESLQQPGVHFLRVHFEPWTSAGSVASVTRYQLTAMPSIIFFNDGKEAARLVGDVKASQIEAKLSSAMPH